MAPADHTGCGYYRMRLPAKYLRAHGHDIAIVDDLGGILPVIMRNGSPTPACRPHRPYDVVWLQRVVSLPLLEYVLAYRAATGCAIVHEQDDNFHAIPGSNAGSQYYGTGKPLTLVHERALAAADLCVMSTVDLADAYKAKARLVAVAHNCIDDPLVASPGAFAPNSGVRREGQVRIGWAGSDTHRADIALVAKPMRKLLAENPNVVLVLGGADLRASFPRDLWPRIEFAGMTYTARPPRASTRDADLPSVRYYGLLRQMDLDIAIAPIEATTFNRSKSALKLLEYGALALPVVASSFGPYRPFGAETLLCSDTREWYDALAWLARDATARDTLACTLNRRVYDQHRMSHGVEEWLAALAAVRRPVPVV